ncbi:hypothetical protein B0H16DRAFT_1696890 [Mycena metata]|uniref:Uncharacterized protein n=1 Tax=Mycena metata TaxID=1033252 RepID=A0AAD7MT30_9AGAR|nr:hypothetical protein B0H16DRAFT_1696890 [Mycena metata]
MRRGSMGTERGEKDGRREEERKEASSTGVTASIRRAARMRVRARGLDARACSSRINSTVCVRIYVRAANVEEVGGGGRWDARVHVAQKNEHMEKSVCAPTCMRAHGDSTCITRPSTNVSVGAGRGRRRGTTAAMERDGRGWVLGEWEGKERGTGQNGTVWMADERCEVSREHGAKKKRGRIFERRCVNDGSGRSGTAILAPFKGALGSGTALRVRAIRLKEATVTGNGRPVALPIFWTVTSVASLQLGTVSGGLKKREGHGREQNRGRAGGVLYNMLMRVNVKGASRHRGGRKAVRRHVAATRRSVDLLKFFVRPTLQSEIRPPTVSSRKCHA